MANKTVFFLLFFATAIAVQEVYVAGSPTSRQSFVGAKFEPVEQKTGFGKGAGEEKVFGEAIGKETEGSHFFKTVSEMFESSPFGKESLGEFGKAFSKMMESSPFSKESLEKGEFGKAVSKMMKSNPFSKEFVEKAIHLSLKMLLGAIVSEMVKNSFFNKESLGIGEFSKSVSKMMESSPFGKDSLGKFEFSKMMESNPFGKGEFGKSVSKMMESSLFGKESLGKSEENLFGMAAGKDIFGKVLGRKEEGSEKKEEGGSLFGAGTNLSGGIIPFKLGQTTGSPFGFFG